MFGLILAFHFRTNVFFFADEYYEIYRISAARTLWSFLLERHNEHFIPVAKLFYLVEVLLFREQYYAYLIVNAAVLALTAVLLIVWLRRALVSSLLAHGVAIAYVTATPQESVVQNGWFCCLVLGALAMVAFALWATDHRRLLWSKILLITASAWFGALCFASLALLPLFGLLVSTARGLQIRLGGESAVVCHSVLIRMLRIGICGVRCRDESILQRQT